MRRDESGFAALELILGGTFLLLMAAGLYVAANWPSEIHAVNAAAYEAARAMAEAPTAEDGADAGRAIAAETMANHGYPSAIDDVSFVVGRRGENIVATVRVTLPALRFPLVGEWAAQSFTRSATVRSADYRAYP